MTDPTIIAALRTITHQLATIIALLKPAESTHTHIGTMGSNHCTTCGERLTP